MVGGTLRDLRERIADRHDDDGRYYVNCARTGERPVPVSGKRFPSREAAVEAAELAAEYRAELRRYDPRLPHYDLVVSESPGAAGPLDPVPVVDHPPESPTASDFCHDVAAAVFESLSALGETDVERGAMEAYLHSAESVTDADELCLVLLSTMATEIDARLDPDRQAEVLRAAAERLGATSAPGGPTFRGAKMGARGIADRYLGDPMEATLARLDGLSLVGDYAVAPNDGRAEDSSRTGEATAGRSWAVTVEGYAFESPDGRVPTLPLAVELYRRLPDAAVAVSDLRATGDAEWECVVSTDAERSRAVSLAVPEDD
ncbi:MULTISPECIES: hypothetical protein [Halorussus]|uniref:DUF7551 domain-containing protein n=1 Tax=Halorussus TaxID=1070314 RepID=UPI000E21956C|nr:MULTISPECIES: hypothetical protein [Halorussus]NHN58854.1 hypothetical protein [Halorussus sp. JP-T4]